MKSEKKEKKEKKKERKERDPYGFCSPPALSLSLSLSQMRFFILWTLVCDGLWSCKIMQEVCGEKLTMYCQEYKK